MSLEDCAKKKDEKNEHDATLKKMLNPLMEQKDKKISYEKLKKEAEGLIGWRRCQWNPPQEEKACEYSCEYSL